MNHSQPAPGGEPTHRSAPFLPQAQPGQAAPPQPAAQPRQYPGTGAPGDGGAPTRILGAQQAGAWQQPPAAPPAPPSRPAGPAGPGAGAPAAGQTRPRGAARVGLAQGGQDGDLDLDAALRAMIESGGSDLHLTSGAQPMIRLDGGLRPLEGYPVLYAEALQRTLYAVLSQKQREAFEEHLELDFAYAVRGVSRFRVNLYRQRDSIGAAFRMIPYEIKPLEALGVPPVVANFAGMPRGLVLVTGPTGSGKSTTLAAIIDLANRSRNDHIMTVEDPIEFLHRHKKSLINQREVGADTHSFANALKHVLRQDPDIILVGEMRDLETISVALTAAETGHLVFATLHTQDAAQTIDRIIDVFPAHQQDQVRTQLASALQGVVCQTLCKKASGKGRAVATEVMLATPAIRNLIREGKTHQIYSAMQAGAQLGMHTLDQHLAELVKTGAITYEVGVEKCHHVADFNRLTGRLGQKGGGTGMGAMSGGDPLGSVTLSDGLGGGQGVMR
ncbi:type IV pilus twitching motility protein PilT [Actinotalea sp.]|uniref:type IV pilus twitching motility protein PilT n=1 Tax=Actinotalea sp. TaxID=1872145 RepID=UPI00356B2C8D